MENNDTQITHITYSFKNTKKHFFNLQTEKLLLKTVILLFLIRTMAYCSIYCVA